MACAKDSPRGLQGKWWEREVEGEGSACARSDGRGHSSDGVYTVSSRY